MADGQRNILGNINYLIKLHIVTINNINKKGENTEIVLT